MLRTKALRKILVTTITLFIFVTIYTIKNIQDENVIDVNLEVEYTNSMPTTNIYLLNNDNYLVKTEVILTKKDKEKQIEYVLECLKEDNKNTYPKELKGVLPKDIEILNIKIDNKYVTINFSKEFLNIKKEIEEKVLETITYSIINLKEIDGIYLEVEGKLLEELPNSKTKISYPLNKSIGINKEYNIQNRNDINKTVVYYLEDIDNTNYYVPVTKYLNSKDDKIKVIIDSLTTSYIYEKNLMSVLNTNLKLNSYNEEENVFFLDFNSNLYDKNNKILEEVIYSISYSVFDNYDVNSIVFSVDGKDVKTVFLSDIS